MALATRYSIVLYMRTDTCHLRCCVRCTSPGLRVNLPGSEASQS